MFKFFVFFLVTAAASFAAGAQPLRSDKVYKRYADTLVIPFAHKQSAIFHAYTAEVLDSVVRILKQDTAIKLSIQGYAYVDEGNDTICKYLSLNRALFINDALLGRGIDSSKITSVQALGAWKPEKKGHYKVNIAAPYRVELLMLYPPPPKEIVISDKDSDGLPDEEDACPDKFGYLEDKGCPLKDVYMLVFEKNQAYITSGGFMVLDKVIALLQANPTFTVTLSGHASKEEGVKSVTDAFSRDRAAMVLKYFASRFLPVSKIEGVNTYGKMKPVNAQRDPQQVIENSSVELIIHKNLKAEADQKINSF